MLAEALITAFLLGLLSSLHCGGMCGGISGALSMSLPIEVRQRPMAMLGYQLLFNFGRISSYVLVGTLVGLLTLAVPDEHMTAGLSYARVVVGVVMMLLALHLTGVLRSLSALEVIGLRLWRRLTPLYRPLLPVKKPLHGLVLGMFWGWLPCGLVYTALAYSVTVPGLGGGALAMGAFGLGTLPALLLTGTGFFLLMRKLPATKVVMAALLFALGAWTVYAGVTSIVGHHHH